MWTVSRRSLDGQSCQQTGRRRSFGGQLEWSVHACDDVGRDAISRPVVNTATGPPPILSASHHLRSPSTHSPFGQFSPCLRPLKRKQLVTGVSLGSWLEPAAATASFVSRTCIQGKCPGGNVPHPLSVSCSLSHHLGSAQLRMLLMAVYMLTA